MSSSSVSVVPAAGKANTTFAVTLLHSGSAAPLHVLADVTGAPITPMSDTTALAFADAVAALSAVLLPLPFIPQRGALLFGLPI